MLHQPILLRVAFEDGEVANVEGLRGLSVEGC